LSIDEELSKAQFFFNYVNVIHVVIKEAQDKLYDKIKDMTSIVTALIPILFGLGYFCLNNSLLQRFLVPIGFTLFCFVVAVCIGFYVLWSNKYVYIDPLDFIKYYEKHDLNFIVLNTAVTWACFINENINLHNKLAKRYKYMLISIVLGIGSLLYTFLLAIRVFINQH